MNNEQTMNNNIEMSYAYANNGNSNAIATTTSLIKLISPLVTLEEKVFFLKQYVSPHAKIHFDGKNNTIKVDIDNKKAISLDEKLLNRVGDYIKTGSISLGTLRLNISRKEALDRLKNMIDRINIQFDMYVRSNHMIMSRIKEKLDKGQQEFDCFNNTQEHLQQLFNQIDEQITNDNLNEHSQNQSQTITQISDNNSNSVSTSSNTISSKNENTNNSLTNSVQSYSLTVDTKVNGLHPSWKNHQFSIDFANLCRKRLLWCNAFATGLGKTATALLTIQDQQNLQLKNKTIFVVPSSTLSKWYKEAFVGKYNKHGEQVVSSVYDETIEDECLFVGLVSKSEFNKKNTDNKLIKKLQENSKYQYLAKDIDEQLEMIADSKYKKIFISHENFFRLRLKHKTVEDYIQLQKSIDDDFAMAEDSETDQFTKRSKEYFDVLFEENAINGKNKKNIFFEDLGIDSIVVDELHIYKNAKDTYIKASNGNSVNNVKYLSTPPLSNIGMDMLAKTNYIRQNNPKHDGILHLTATPLTNSPVEIYSVLSLIIGEYYINALLGVHSLSEFLSLICNIETEEDYSVDGELRNYNIFKGIQNLKLLRNVLFRCIYFLMEDDERVKDILVLPESKEINNNVLISKYQQKKIFEYKQAYNACKEAKHILEDLGYAEYMRYITEDADFKRKTQSVLNKFHEDVLIVASPFNFIRKMERLILDEDLNEMATIYFIKKDTIDNNEVFTLEKLNKIVDKFNKKKFKQKGFRLNVHTDEESIFNTLEKEVGEDQETGEPIFKTVYEFYSKAKIVDFDTEKDKRYNDISAYVLENNGHEYLEDMYMIVLDTTKYNEQKYFIYCLLKEKFKLTDIHVNKSAKIKELIKNIKQEHDNPRGKLMTKESTDLVKQLIFCDQLSEHIKLQLLLNNEVGIEFDKTVVATGQTNGENEQIQAIQDGFNAEEEENVYQIVIGNQKIQEGIDLQLGTQAIHHITIGWTPDSLVQRNGRGVRQGNQTEYVNVNHYDAENTFDNYKRNLVNKKESWIRTVIDKNSDVDSVDIEYNLTREQQERMIELIGYSSEEKSEAENNLKAFEERIQKERELLKIKQTKEKQKIYLDFLMPLNEKKHSDTNDSQQEKDDDIKNEENYVHYYQETYTAIASEIGKTARKINKFLIDEGYITNNLTVQQLFEPQYKEKMTIQVLRQLKTIALMQKYLKELVETKLIHFIVNADVWHGKLLSDMQDLSIKDRKIKYLTEIVPNEYITSTKALTYCFATKNTYNIIQKNLKSYFFIRSSEYDNYILSNETEENEHIIQTEIKDINKLNYDIEELSQKSFIALTENNKYAYYPLDIINSKHIYKVFNDMIAYETSILMSIDKSINSINTFNNEQREFVSNDDVINEIKNIIYTKHNVQESEYFIKAEQIKNYLLKNRVVLSLFTNDENSPIKMYPLERKEKISLFQNQVASMHNKKYHRQFIDVDAYNSVKRYFSFKENQLPYKSRVIRAFELNLATMKEHINDLNFYEYYSNNKDYQYLIIAMSLLEYYYMKKLHNNREYVYASRKHDNWVEFCECLEVIKDKKQRLGLQHQLDLSVLKDSEIKTKVLDIENKTNDMVVDIKNTIRTEKEKEQLLVQKLLAEAQAASAAASRAKNDRLKNLEIELRQAKNIIDSKYKDDDYLWVATTYANHEKYNLRGIADEVNQNIYFHKANTAAYRFEEEKELYNELVEYYGIDELKKIPNMWYMGVKAIKLLLHRMKINNDLVTDKNKQYADGYVEIYDLDRNKVKIN